MALHNMISHVSKMTIHMYALLSHGLKSIMPKNSHYTIHTPIECYTEWVVYMTVYVLEAGIK